MIAGQECIKGRRIQVRDYEHRPDRIVDAIDAAILQWIAGAREV
jgi:hypothetical protein